MKEGHAVMREGYETGPRNDFTGITPAKSGRYGAAKCDVAIRHSRGPHVRALPSKPAAWPPARSSIPPLVTPSTPAVRSSNARIGGSGRAFVASMGRR